MSFVYLLALVGVGVSILWLLVDAVMAVSRKPQWEVPVRSFAVVATTDRRAQPIPFVGAERRKSQSEAEQVEENRLAA